MIKDCKMRHENGNCLPAGGFCTANKNICEALQNAYNHGYFEGIQKGFEKGGEQKWIPVSERLPKDNKTKIVQIKGINVVEAGYYSNGDWWCINSAGTLSILEVVAWMELPEPYRRKNETESLHSTR